MDPMMMAALAQMGGGPGGGGPPGMPPGMGGGMPPPPMGMPPMPMGPQMGPAPMPPQAPGFSNNQPPQPTGDQVLDLVSQAAYLLNMAVMMSDPAGEDADYLSGLQRDAATYVAHQQGGAARGPQRMDPGANEGMSFPVLPDVPPPPPGMEGLF